VGPPRVDLPSGAAGAGSGAPALPDVHAPGVPSAGAPSSPDAHGNVSSPTMNAPSAPSVPEAPSTPEPPSSQSLPAAASTPSVPRMDAQKLLP
jgi:hypothetical protein